MPKSYLDQNENYRRAKKGMPGMSAGLHEPDEEKKEKSRLLSSLLSAPSIDNAYRQWKSEGKNFDKYEGVPFEDMAEEYDSREAREEREEKRKARSTPIYKEEDFSPEYHEEWNTAYQPDIEKRAARESEEGDRKARVAEREEKNTAALFDATKALDECMAAENQMRGIMDELKGEIAHMDSYRQPAAEGASKTQQKKALYKSRMFSQSTFDGLQADMERMSKLLDDFHAKTEKAKAEYERLNKKSRK